MDSIGLSKKILVAFTLNVCFTISLHSQPVIDISAPIELINDFGSVVWGDYDDDHDMDILLSGDSITIIYRNDDGNFVDIRVSLLGVCHGNATWVDYDKDGDLDIFMAGSFYDGVWKGITKIYQNDEGNFVDIDTQLPSVEWGFGDFGDYNNDRDLDLLLTGRPFESFISRLYRNDKGNFEYVAAELQPDDQLGEISDGLEFLWNNDTRIPTISKSVGRCFLRHLGMGTASKFT